MKTVAELRQFYETELLPSLQELEDKRKSIVNNLIIVLGGVGAMVVVFALVTSHPGALFFLPFALIVIYAIVYFMSSRDYVNDFKMRIIKELIRFVDPNLHYEKDNYISQPVYLASEIFKSHVDRYNGKDYVAGKVGATQIGFSKIHSEYKTEKVDRDGHRRTSWTTIFCGVFFVGDFNKNCKGRTVVLPDVAEQLFGFLGATLQSMNITRGELIKLEDPEFEKMFVVYGDDQVESRFVLSTSLMKRIADFKKKSKSQIYLSFIGSKIFVAIDHREDLFEPPLFKTLLDFTPVQDYYEHLELVLGIVDDLNLNTRIWGKA